MKKVILLIAALFCANIPCTMQAKDYRNEQEMDTQHNYRKYHRKNGTHHYDKKYKTTLHHSAQQARKCANACEQASMQAALCKDNHAKPADKDTYHACADACTSCAAACMKYANACEAKIHHASNRTIANKYEKKRKDCIQECRTCIKHCAQAKRICMRNNCSAGVKIFDKCIKHCKHTIASCKAHGPKKHLFKRSYHDDKHY